LAHIKMKRLLQILFLLTLTSCGQQQNPDKETWDKIDETIKEVEPPKEQTPPSIEYSIGDLKFIFSNLTDPYDLGLYQRIEVKLNDSSQVIIELCVFNRFDFILFDNRQQSTRTELLLHTKTDRTKS